MKNKAIVLFSLFTILFIWDLDKVMANEMDYGVQANIPENQLDKSKTYFDLLMTPGMEQDISLTIMNNSDAETKIRITPNTAVTNTNGIIDYSKVNTKKDLSMKVEFVNLIEGSKLVTLVGKEVKTVTFKIKMPKEQIEGTVLGGFYIHKEDGPKEAENTKSATQITNDFAYVIGVKLSEEEKVLPVDMKLNKVSAGLRNYHTTVLANLQNKTPELVTEMNVNAEVRKKGGNHVLYKSERNGLSMAPNSNFDYGIDLNDSKLEDGDYTLSMKVKSKQGIWDFTKDFSVTKKETQKINSEAVNLVDEQPTTLIYGILIGIIILLLVLIIFIYMKKRKK